jgi:hypothetical protein
MPLRHVLAFACLALPAPAFAHTVLETPAPLSANFKSEPCGCVIGGTSACDDPYATTV